MGFILPIVIILMLGLTLPPVADIAVGHNTLPNNALYGIERAGESIRTSFGVLSQKDVVNERIDEATRLANMDLPEKAFETLDDADKSLLNVPASERREIQEVIDRTRLNIESGRIR